MTLESPRGTVVVSAGMQDFYEATHVPAAVRNGSTVWVTGQTGTLDDGSVVADVDDQIRRAFANVEGCLRAAGAAWDDVVELTSYVVGLRQLGDTMLAIAGEFLQPPYPAWTAVGVTELWEEGAIFELRCVAVTGHAA